MALLIIAMLLVVLLGVAIVGVVAVPAHRDGRDLLTSKGEGVARSVTQRGEGVVRGARRRLGVPHGASRARTH